MENKQSYNQALHENMIQLDAFYKSASLLFQTAREMLIQNYNYIDVRDARLAYAYSSAIRRPHEWLPQYLCIYLKHKEKDEHIALITMLKNPYVPDNKPLETFWLHGFKINDSNEKRLDRICRRAIINPEQGKIQYADKGHYTEVVFYDQKGTVKMIKTDLWEIDDVEKLASFIARTASL